MLNPATKYYARVKAINQDAESDYSNVIEITTLPSNVQIPPENAPNNPVIKEIRVNSTQVQFIINRPEEIEQLKEYKLTISTVSDFSSNILDKLVYILDENTSTIFIDEVEYVALSVNNLAPNTIHYVKLQSSNNTGLSSEVTFNFTTKTIIKAPVLVGVTSLSAINATIKWVPISGAIDYRIDIADNINFTSPVVNNVTVAGTEYTVNSLVELTEYFYRVRTSDGSEISSNSDVLSFTTLDGANTYTGLAININKPTILSRTNILTNRFSISWNGREYVDNYTIDVATDALFSSIIFTSTVIDTKVTITGLNSGTNYYFRVRANNDYMSTAYSDTIVTTLVSENAVTPPQALTPFNIYSSGFILNWIKRSYATNYYIEISTINDFSNIIQTYYVNDIDTLTIDKLSSNTTYYLRVYGLSSIFISEPSAFITVTTETSLPNITSGTSTVTSDSATLTWVGNIVYVDYELTIYKTVDGISLVPINTRLFNKQSIGDVLSYIVNILLEPDTNYKWRITGITESGDSLDSDLYEFTTTKQPSFLQLDYINHKLTWSGQINRIDISLDSDFKFCIDGWDNRNIGNVIEIDIANVLQEYPHVYIRGSFDSGTTISEFSNTIHTLNLVPIIMPQEISDSLIKLRWVQGKAVEYYIQVEEFNGVDFQLLSNYITPVSIGYVNEFSLNVTPNTQYRFTLYFREISEIIEILQKIVYKSNKHTNRFNLPINNAITTPITTANSISFDRICLDFSHSESILGYRVSLDPNFDSILIDREINTTKAIIYALPNTTYYVETISINGLGERSAVESNSFTTLAYNYNPVSLSGSPSLGAVTVLNSSEVRILFTGVTGADAYKLEISESPTFSVLNTNPTITYRNSEIIVSGLLSTKQYYARIYAYNRHNVSLYSASVLLDTTP